MKATLFRKTTILPPFRWDRAAAVGVRKKQGSLLCCLMVLTVLFGAVAPLLVSAAEEEETVVSDSHLAPADEAVNGSDISPTEEEETAADTPLSFLRKE